MEQHPHFVTKKTNYEDITKNFEFVDGYMKKYDKDELRLVGYDIEKGTIVYVGLDNENKPMYKKVASIMEERPSKGEFKNHIRPTSYHVTMEKL